MIFAIKEINNNPDILPGVRVGYRIYDECGVMDIMRAALSLVSGEDDNCTNVHTAQAILGHSGSTPTIAFQRVVGRFHIPVVSITGCKKSG